METINGQLIEKVTFSNGITDYFYSIYLHKINAICDLYGYDANNFAQFRLAEDILKKQQTTNKP